MYPKISTIIDCTSTSQNMPLVMHTPYNTNWGHPLLITGNSGETFPKVRSAFALGTQCCPIAQTACCRLELEMLFT